MQAGLPLGFGHRAERVLLVIAVADARGAVGAAGAHAERAGPREQGLLVELLEHVVVLADNLSQAEAGFRVGKLCIGTLALNKMSLYSNQQNKSWEA